MDLLSSTLDGIAEQMRESLGLESLTRSLREQREEVEKTAKGWERLAAARRAAEEESKGPSHFAVEQGSIYRLSQTSGGSGYARYTYPKSEFDLSGFTAKQRAELIAEIERLRYVFSDIVDDLELQYEELFGKLPKKKFSLTVGGKTTVPTDESLAQLVESQRAEADRRFQEAVSGVQDYIETRRQSVIVEREHAAALQEANDRGRAAVEAETKRAVALRASTEAAKLAGEYEDVLSRRRRAALDAQSSRAAAAGALGTVLPPDVLLDADRGWGQDYTTFLRDRRLQARAGAAVLAARRGQYDIGPYGVSTYVPPTDEELYYSQATSEALRRKEAQDLEQLIERNRRESERLKEVYDTIGASAASAFESFVTGARSASDAAKQLGIDIYTFLVQRLVTLPLQNALASILTSLFPGLGSALSTPKQHGGVLYGPSLVLPLGGGRASLIGERGPEEVRPTYARSGRGSPNYTIVVNAAGGGDSWRRSLRQTMADLRRAG
jgi:hypothetical protein